MEGLPSSAGRIWFIPPPPGTEFDEEEAAGRNSRTIDPYVKSTDYLRYERQRRRSRSRSAHRTSGRRRHSRSRSRGRHKHHSRRHRSSSRSRSRSHGRRPHAKRSDRHSRSKSRSTSRSKRPPKTHSRRGSRSRDSKASADPKIKTEPEVEEEEEDTSNAFKNDGSFMEMFKKMQEEMQTKTQQAEQAPVETKPNPPILAFGKRRGGKVLKTGVVQKSKVPGQEETTEAQDAWSLYMKEVKRYKDACCDDDTKTRLLVK